MPNQGTEKTERTERGRCEIKKIREMVGESNSLMSVHSRAMASNPVNNENNLYVYILLFCSIMFPMY